MERETAMKILKELHDNSLFSNRTALETIIPELADGNDERIRKDIIAYIKKANGEPNNILPSGSYCVLEMITWLEKQGEQPSAIRWYDVSLIPQEMEELLVEWDSEDATWHEIAFYHADTKTFWNGTRQVENVTRWCYIIDLLEKQGEPKQEWSDEDEKIRKNLMSLLSDMRRDRIKEETYQKYYPWLKSLKDRIKGKEEKK